MEMNPSGSVLWVLTEDRVVYIDPNTMSSGSFIHGLSNTWGNTFAVTNNKILVMSASSGEIRAFDYSGTLSGSFFPSSDYLRDLVVVNDHIVMLATDEGMQVYDFSGSATLEKELRLDVGPRTLLVREDLCYVSGDNGLEILNITDPLNPQKIGYTSTPATSSLAIFEDIAYLTHVEDYTSDSAEPILTVVDIATPSYFQSVGTVELTPIFFDPRGAWSNNYFVCDGNHLYAVTPNQQLSGYDSTLHAINIANPKNLYQSDSVSIPCINEFRSISCSPGDYLAMAYGESGIFIQFLYSGQQYSRWYATNLDNVSHTLVDSDDGTKLWVADDNGVFLLNITRSDISEVRFYQTNGSVREILKATATHVYVLTSDSSVNKIVRIDKTTGNSLSWDISLDPLVLQWLWKTAITSDDKLIVSYTKANPYYTNLVRIYIYDFSGDDLVLRRELEYTYPDMTNLSIQDNQIYLSSQIGLTTIDIGNVDYPVILGTQKLPSTPVQATKIGDLVYTFGRFGIMASPLLEKIDTTYVSPTKLDVTIPSQELDGNYTLRVSNGPAFNDLPGAITFTDVERLLTSTAIIVAGRKADDLVWTETKAYADQAYENLRFQGYAPDDIIYLTADGVGTNVDGIATNANLQNAIAAITNGTDPDKKDLLLYLVDHGGPGTYQLNESEALAALDLDGWLDALQNSASADNQVVVAYDACRSASFLRYLKPPVGKIRIIMTSSDVDQSAYFLNSSHSFSAHLWSSFSGRTGETVNLSNGFWQAADMMVEYQAAQLDADGDGVPNEPNDETVLANLENGHLYAVRRGYNYRRADRPVIGGIAADQVITGTSQATLSASGVYDADGISRVFAVIIPPDFVPDPDQTITDQLGTEELVVDAGNPENYHLNYSGFDQHGTYIVTYYAEDAHGICSLPSTSLVTLMDLTSTSPLDDYEEDDSPTSAAGVPRVILPNDLHSQFHTFHNADDEDWAIFYAAAGIYNIRVDNVSAICDPQIEIFTESNTTTPIQTINAAGMGQGELGTWNCTADGIYYLRLTNLSGHWGANVWYSLRLYNPGAFSYDGFLSGVVTDSQTSQALIGAEIVTDIGTAYSQPNGSYVMGLNAGSHTVTATKESYQPDSFEVTIATGNDQARDIQLAKPNSAPVISQGTSISVTMSEDGSPTPWSAPAVSATDADGDTLSWSLASGPAHGNASVSGTGASPTTLTYNPFTNYHGTDSFIVRVTDGELSDTIIVNVTIASVNDAPVIDQGGSVSASMSEDGSPTAWSTPTVTATDADGNSLTWSLASSPSHGGATVSGTGSSPPTFIYSPTANYYGSDSFVVRVSDGHGGMDTITVNMTIDPINDAPVITSAATVNTAENQTSVITVTASEVDTGDTPTFSITGGVDQGFFSITSGDLTFTSARDYETYTDADHNGVYEVEVTANDGNGGTDNQAILVTVINVNEAPTLLILSNSIIAENTDTSGGYTVGFLTATDPDAGDTATYTIVGGVDAAVFSISSNNLILTDGILNYEAKSSYEVTVQVTDSGALTHDQPFTITVTDINEVPVITQTGPLTVSMSEDGSPTLWTAPTVDATDGDDDILTWILLSGPSHGIATVSGTGVSPAPFTYIPDTDYNGADSFEVQVSDGQGGNDSITVNVTINAVNDAPTAVIASPPVSVDENAAGTALSASGSGDIDDDELTYSWQVLSGSAVLHDSNTDSPTFDPPDVGPDGAEIIFQLTVSDGFLNDTAQCTVTVNWVPYVDVECIPANVRERRWVAISITADPDATLDTIDITKTAGSAAENWDDSGLPVYFTAPNVAAGTTEDLTFEVKVTYEEDPQLSATDTCTVTVHDIPEDFDHDEDIDGADLAEFINNQYDSDKISTFAAELGQ